MSDKYAQNKPLLEHGDLQSVHHHLAHMQEVEEQQQIALAEAPPALVVVEGPGNLYTIKWTHTLKDIPRECAGAWNHKGKATEAIKGSMTRIAREAKANAAEITNEVTPKPRKATGKPVKV